MDRVHLQKEPRKLKQEKSQRLQNFKEQEISFTISVSHTLVLGCTATCEAIVTTATSKTLGQHTLTVFQAIHTEKQVGFFWLVLVFSCVIREDVSAPADLLKGYP